MIDTNGQVVVPIRYDAIDELDRKEGLFEVEVSGKKALYSSALGEILPPEFTSFRKTHTGHITAESTSGWGMYDKEGHCILTPQYKKIYSYGQDFIRLQQDTLRGAFRPSDSLLIPCLYDEISRLGPYFLVKKDGFQGLLKGNEWLIPPAYQGIQMVSDERFWAMKDNLWGLIDQNNKVLYPFDLHYAGDFHGPVAIVKQDAAFGLIHHTGEVILPIQYRWIKVGKEMVQVWEDNTWKHYLLNEEGHLREQPPRLVIRGKKAYSPKVKIPRQPRRNTSPPPNPSNIWYKQQSKWGLRAEQGGRVLISPTYHQVDQLMRYGLTVVTMEYRDIRATQSDAYVYREGLVHHRSGRRLTKVNYAAIYANDFGAGPVARAYYPNGTYVLVNARGQEKSIGKATYIGPFTHGLASVCIEGKPIQRGEKGIRFWGESPQALRKMGGKWGFIDAKGRWQMEPQYDFIGPFRGGTAQFKQGGQWGLIDTSLSVIVPPHYDELRDYIADRHQCGGYRTLPKNYLVTIDYRNKYAFFDTLGMLQFTIRAESCGTFHEGRVRVKQAGLWGYYDLEGRQVIPSRYRLANDFQEGLALVQDTFGLYGYITPSGEWAISPRWRAASDFQEGLAWVKEGRRYGHIHPNGEWAIPPKYLRVNHFQEGLAIVKGKNGYGVIDQKGKTVVPLHYRMVDFEGPYIKVKKGGEYGFVDRKGRMVCPIKYRFIGCFADGTIWVYKDQHISLLDIKGKPLPLPPYASLKMQGDSLAMVTLAGKSFMINSKGERVKIAPEKPNYWKKPIYRTLRNLGYEHYSPAREGFVVAEVSQTYGLMDSQGNQLIPATLDAIRYEQGIFTFIEDTQIRYMNSTGKKIGTKALGMGRID